MADSCERMRHGVLSSCAAGDDLELLAAREQRRRRIPSELWWQRYHQVIDHIAIAESVDRTFENRSSPQRQELLGLCSAEAMATATGRDDS